MAEIAVGQSSPRGRSLNHELPLVPFIDFLLCLVAFLLVTAVWSQMARLSVSANVPGSRSQDAPDTERRLHIEQRSADHFTLVWRDGDTVVRSVQVPRKPTLMADGESVRYHELALALADEWKNFGVHRSPTDPREDILVVHAPNTQPFSEIAGIFDTAHAPQRFRDGVANKNVRAFTVALSVQ